jgi:hypothetical protein
LASRNLPFRKPAANGSRVSCCHNLDFAQYYPVLLLCYLIVETLRTILLTIGPDILAAPFSRASNAGVFAGPSNYLQDTMRSISRSSTTPIHKNAVAISVTECAVAFVSHAVIIYKE